MEITSSPCLRFSSSSDAVLILAAILIPSQYASYNEFAEPEIDNLRINYKFVNSSSDIYECTNNARAFLQNQTPSLDTAVLWFFGLSSGGTVEYLSFSDAPAATYLASFIFRLVMMAVASYRKERSQAQKPND
jgi:hypothetical protein